MALPGFDIVHFPAAADEEGVAEARLTAWFQATSAGFHDQVADAERMRTTLDHVVRDGRSYTSVFDTALPEGLDGLAVPVGTYATFGKQLNVGGRMLDAHLITGVTVRPTHRRRGILRELMTGDLAAAAERGAAVALLTASEASIYRRFGFGKASFTRTIRVDTGPRFGLIGEPSGRVEVVEAGWLGEHTAAIFALFHARTPGSLERSSRYADSALGAGPGEKVPTPNTRAAVHVTEDGTLDGYVTYKVAGEGALEVIDLVAAGTDAYLGLWRFLAAIDLITTVRWDLAPVDDPLTWALRDSRVVTVESVDDVLWARILDPVAAFEARGYLPITLSHLIRVHDPLGHADGLFQLSVDDGDAEVEREDRGQPALELPVSALGSLLLGTARPSMLVRAGEATVAHRSLLPDLDALFAPVATPYCIAHF
ncbi:GNAT family N-acetyltransferase [Microbacteriaceae bacterium VKM Ac-2854]|nr:GNAT family N-acetyltransferase [Microbacteriaceae bacterium VKM Ac-2854]